MTELVDELRPPQFERTGKRLPLHDAWSSGAWIGTFNLWIVQNKPIPAIIYQQRSSRSSWAPNLLDVAVGGHYQAGETGTDGLREAEEELGRSYRPQDVSYIGRRLNVSHDEHGRERKNVVSIFMVIDNTALEAYTLDPHEVRAVVSCGLTDLKRLYGKSAYEFESLGRTADGAETTLCVRRTSFPENWDDYQPRMVHLAERFLAGDPNIVY